jgi:hypothetical protein
MAVDPNDNLRQWLEQEINRNQEYHNHKERMTWIGTAFYIPSIIGLGYGIRSLNICCTALIICLIAFLAAIFCFLWFQFDNRWTSAGRIEGLIRTIASLHRDQQLSNDDWNVRENGFYPVFIENNIPRERHFHLDNGRWRVELTSYVAITLSTIIAGFLALNH